MWLLPGDKPKRPLPVTSAGRIPVGDGKDRMREQTLLRRDRVWHRPEDQPYAGSTFLDYWPARRGEMIRRPELFLLSLLS
jgi:hypothetical protein